jgi:hypothetical protein
VEGQCIIARMKWKKKGNSMNKELFTIVKEYSTFSFRYYINEKKNCDFYQALYSNPLPTPQTFQI